MTVDTLCRAGYNRLSLMRGRCELSVIRRIYPVDNQGAGRKKRHKRIFMDTRKLKEIFTDEVLAELFPPQRADDFFEALFGDASEGAYDIRLAFSGYDAGTSTLKFDLDLHERPGNCLVCSLTHGLPQVFSRHPVTNIKGLVEEIESKLGGMATCTDWKLGSTSQRQNNLHSIPLLITVQAA